MKKILLGLLVCLSFNLTACGGNVTSSKTEIATTVKGVVQDKEVKAGKEFTKDALEKLKSELEFINSDNIENVSVTIAFSGQGYNSLNKDFYDVQVHGKLGDNQLTVELFLFTDEKGKVTDVGTWSRTLE